MDSLLQSGEWNDIVRVIGRLRSKKMYPLLYMVCAQWYPFYSSRTELFGNLAYSLFRLGRFSEAWEMYQRLLTMTEIRLTHAQADVYWREAFEVYAMSKKTHKMSIPTIGKVCGVVTFTITTCKRLDTFIRTMNSFLNCCRDRSLIARWICIDDNSSEQDRTCMRELFPFFEFIWKTEEEKGHPLSMNRLLETVQTPYMFHMEDDWEWIVSDTYIQKCMNVLQENAAYGQCLLNRHYAETEEDMELKGGVAKYDAIGDRYWEHLLDTSPPAVRSNAYWPHYSLRPGLNRVRVLREVGAYSYGRHFEWEFAKRYTRKGFKTVFLDGIYGVHIGRLTGERGERSGIPNAYTLNGQIQF